MCIFTANLPRFGGLFLCMSVCEGRFHWLGFPRWLRVVVSGVSFWNGVCFSFSSDGVC